MEFARCLRWTGTLYYKIAYNGQKSTDMTRREDINLMIDFSIVGELVKKSGAGWSKAHTSFLTMKPKRSEHKHVWERYHGFTDRLNHLMYYAECWCGEKKQFSEEDWVK